MKILILNGSPKREKSDCMHMTRAFVAGIKETLAKNGEVAEIRTVHVVDLDVKYCRGCFSCMRNEGNCVIEDDMKEILREILSCELLIFSFPLYCYGMPSSLKAVLDRTLPLSKMSMRKTGDKYEHIAGKDFSRLRYVMISGCGFPSGKNNFEGMTAQFGLMFGEDATVIAVPQSPVFNVPEAASVTVPFLETVKQAGREYATSGKISAPTTAALGCPMIPEEEYVRIVNGGGI